MRRIAVLTSGGDAPGMNAAIRAATCTAVERRADVLGARRGYAGLIEGDFVPLTTAARLAGPQGPLHVTVAVAISPLSATESDYRTGYLDPHNAWLRTEAQRIADRAIEPFRAKGAKCTTKVLEGKPVSAVLTKEASSGQYDLVVMSSRGMGQQHDRLRYLGSVTEHVIRRVSIPVLVVPIEEVDEDD